MDTNTFDPNTLTLLVAIVGSTVAIITLLLRQINRLDSKFTAQISGLDTKFTAQMSALDTKFTAQISALDTKFDAKLDSHGGVLADTRERLARIEGHLLGPATPPTTAVRPAVSQEPPPREPGPGNSIGPDAAILGPEGALEDVEEHS